MTMNMDEKRTKVMVTGGLGYVGSHCVIELVLSGYDVIIIDNLRNSQAAAYDRIVQLLKLPHHNDRVVLFETDLLDLESLKVVFAECYPFDVVMHLAGLKSVGESVLKPMLYYHNNLVSTINLLQCMKSFKVQKLIFSSSATVYGTPEKLPLTEDHPTGRNLTNTYGQTKYMIEQMLFDLVKSEQLAHAINHKSEPKSNNCDLFSTSITILRYFNPVGADSSGQIGECPSGVPANLMPYISKVAAGKLTVLNVYGNDYKTPDGTGIRDYLHVSDLAKGHVDALKHMTVGQPCIKVYNLGTGKGLSVMEMVKAMEKAANRKIPIEYKERREGDIESVYCDPSLAEKELNWKAKKTVEDMCNDQWRWQSMNPDGYCNK